MNKDSIIEVIRKRSSWRSYNDSKSIAPEVLNVLQEYIRSKNQTGPFKNIARFQLVKIPDSEKHKLNSAYGTYGFIRGAEYFIAGAISKNLMHLEDFGYLMEQIILKATQLELGTCWLGGTFKRSTFARVLDLQNNEILPAISPLGVPSEIRRPIGKLIRSVIRAKVRKPWSDLFFDDKFAPIDPESLNEPLKTALEMVRLAPSAKNKQPWRLVVEKQTRVHFFIKKDPHSAEVLNYQKLDIGIAMCHFELSMNHFEKKGMWKTLKLDFPINSFQFQYLATWEQVYS